MQIIDESPAEFPSVSFCDSNPFTTLESQLILEKIMQQYTDTYNVRYLLSLKSGIGLSQFGFYNYYLYTSNRLINPSFDVFHYSTTYTMNPYLFTDSQRKSLGWDLSKVFIKCKFNGIDCDINNDFKWYFSFQYGNCYHFSPIPLNNQVNGI